MRFKLEVAGKVLASILLMYGCIVFATYAANLISDGPMDVKGDLVRGLHWTVPFAIAIGLVIAIIDNRKPKN